jgi:hypothetical protein
MPIYTKFDIYVFHLNKGNNKITEHRAIFQRERQNSQVNKQTKSVKNRKTGKTGFGSNKTKGPMQDSQTRCDVYRDVMTNIIQTDCS